MPTFFRGAGAAVSAFSVSVLQHPLVFFRGTCNFDSTPTQTRLRLRKSVADGHILFRVGADKLRDEESNRRIQALKPKKQTATMKRRALKPRKTKKVDREFLARVQVEHEAITT
jgi:hypothetical protein